VLRFSLERALGDGRFHEIRPLTEQLLQASGKAPASPQYLVSIYIWQTLALALRGNRKWFSRNIGGLAADVDKSTSLRAHVAFIYALFNELDDARACYQPLLHTAFLDDARDDEWLMSLVLIADAAAACGDKAAASELYPRL